MADKRMFSLKIVDSDLFLDMPLSSQCERGVRTKTWTHIRALKGVIYVFKRTEGKGAMYLSSDRICYRYGAPTWLSQQRTSVHMDS